MDKRGFDRPVRCAWCPDDADEDEDGCVGRGSANAVGKGDETTGEEVSEGVLRAWLTLRWRSSFRVELRLLARGCFVRAGAVLRWGLEYGTECE